MLRSSKQTGRKADARRVMRRMKQLLTAVRGQLDQELRPLGITTAQLQLLHQIKGVDACTGAKLARAMNVTPQTTQSLLARLEREGWVQRGRDGENGRLVMWSLTEAGERLLLGAERAFEALQERLWQGFSVKSIRELEALLARCLANLGE